MSRKRSPRLSAGRSLQADFPEVRLRYEADTEAIAVGMLLMDPKAGRGFNDQIIERRISGLALNSSAMGTSRMVGVTVREMIESAHAAGLVPLHALTGEPLPSQPVASHRRATEGRVLQEWRKGWTGTMTAETPAPEPDPEPKSRWDEDDRGFRARLRKAKGE